MRADAMSVIDINTPVTPPLVPVPKAGVVFHAFLA
jgi:hypothetical protein